MVDDVDEHHAVVGDVEGLVTESVHPFLLVGRGGTELVDGGLVGCFVLYHEFLDFIEEFVVEIGEGAEPPVWFVVMGGEDRLHFLCHV